MAKDIPDGFVANSKGGPFAAAAGPFYFNPHEPVRMAFRAEARHTNPNASVHGGALMTLADQAQGAVLGNVLPADQRFATISMNCDFLSAAREGEWVEARAEIVRRTKSLVFTQVEVEADGRLVMTASGLWKLFGDEDAAP